ncbi:MAG: TonB family protein [Deltaproteobacteria bacterium]|nr:TonB family protein [Deltaproteobacteria bacterium]
MNTDEHRFGPRGRPGPVQRTRGALWRARGRERRWPFVAASLAVHALLVLPLVLVLPGSPPAWRDGRVVVSLLSPEEPVPERAEPRPAAAAPSLELAVPRPVPAAPVPAAEPESAAGRRPVRGARRVARAEVAAIPSAAGDVVGGAEPVVAPAAAGVASGGLEMATGIGFGPRPPGPGSGAEDESGGPGIGPPSLELGAGTGVGAGGATGEGASPDPDPCRAASAAVRAAVDARKRYPPVARRRGISGTVEVAFVVAADGTVAEVRVALPSGAALLDEAALEAVRAAAPFAVGGCRFELPVRFFLE